MIACGDEWSQERPREGTGQIASLWRFPVHVAGAIAAMNAAKSQESTLSFSASITGARKSSVRHAASSRWRLHKKHVRFKGMLSPWAVIFLSFLTRFFCERSVVLIWWDQIIALFNAVDFLMLPLAALAREYHVAQGKWKQKFGEAAADYALSKYKIWASLEIILDIVFVADFLVRMARASVLDMGYEVSTVNRMLVSSVIQNTDGGTVNNQDITITPFSDGLQLGPALRKQMFRSIPMRILLMIPMWVVHNVPQASNAVVTCAALTRIYRLLDLMQYFSARQEDYSVDVRWVAVCKFTFIIYATVLLLLLQQTDPFFVASKKILVIGISVCGESPTQSKHQCGLLLQGHWLGCIYFGMAAFSAFDTSLFQMNWVDAWIMATSVNFDWLTSSSTYDYVVR